MGTGSTTVPPHARRSTRGVATDTALLVGSSARAEIDPRGCLYRPRLGWFLRTRGDRPWTRRRQSGSSLVPPHARRSTPEAEEKEPEKAGSSARAEIDPRLALGLSIFR